MGYARQIPLWRRAGFRVELHFLSLPSAETTPYGRRRDLEIVPTLSRGAWTISARAGESRLTDWEARDASRLELLVRRDFRRGWATLSAVRATFSDTATVQRETTYVVAGFPFRSRVESTGSVDRGYEMGQAEVESFLEELTPRSR